MNRLDKCIALKEKGYTYDKDTGKIYGIRGNEILRKHKDGYINITLRSIKGELRGHHFAWFMTYGNVDFELLDHINRIKTDNRISNLRILTNQQNTWNSNSKGISYHKERKKWISRITKNRKTIHLGWYNTEEEARQAYLNAKKNYHQI
jgi:hypothetical protein